MAFCVCIVFSRTGERINQTLVSVFEQDFPDLRLFLLDNACPGFDHAGLEEIICQNKKEKDVKIIISRNSRRANGSGVFKQCVKAAEGCDFTILYPDEIFINPTILTQASIQLQKNTLFYVKYEDEIIPFFSKDFNMSLKLDPKIISVRLALGKARKNALLLDKLDWISRVIFKLNYSLHLKLESIINNLINLNFIKYNVHNFEREIQNEIADVLARPMGCRWNIPESERAYISFLQQILEILSEAGAKGRWKYSELKKDMKALLERAKSSSESKIKIVFFAQEYSVWPSLQSFYDACNKDERFIAQPVYIPFSHQNYKDGHAVPNEEMEPYWKAGYPIMPYTMYDLSKESPDVAVFVKPYDLIPMQFYIYDIDKVVRRSMYIGYGFEGAFLVGWLFRQPCVNMVWKYVVYGECVKEAYTEYGFRNGENCVAWGNPRVDFINKIKNESISTEWNKKINGRKVILWTPHHTIEYGTFFEYKDVILKYFEENKNIFLLLRPHPLMLKAFINNGMLTEKDVEKLINMIEQSDNIILDTSSSYLEAFSISAAIMTDGTNFLKEYLLLDRPMLYTTGSAKEKHLFPEMDEGYHIATSPEHVLDFLEMIRSGNDYKQKDRERIKNKFIFMPPDGVGEYIKEQIIKSVIAEENLIMDTKESNINKRRKNKKSNI